MSNETSIHVAENAKSNTASIFVTGGSGMLGSHLIKTLINQNKRVKAIYRNTIPTYDGSEKVEWCKGDIQDILFLEEVMVDVSTVYHCAAIVSFNPKNKRELYKINVEGTANVVNAALLNDVDILCHVSSVASLGKPEGLEIDETNSWNNADVKSHYAKSKYLGELEVWRGIGEGMKAVIINPSIILGAGDWKSGSSKIFQTAYNEFPWYTEGITGFVDIKDVVNAMIQLTDLKVTNERFIISAENKTYQNIFNTIASNFGKNKPYKKVTPLLAGILSKLEEIKSIFSNEKPLLTKETAEAAFMTILYRNEKLIKFIPNFLYTSTDNTIERVCKELKLKYSLV